jgi:hypothetical protein
VKVLFPLIGLVTLVTVCFGQSSTPPKPDLSGTWEFDAARSSVGRSKKSSPERVKITHHDPELIIRRKVIINGVPQERDLTYYTDGRSERNPTTDRLTTNTGPDSFKPAETASKTIWSKDKIVTRSITRTNAGAAIIDVDIIDELRLSPDGKTLTRTTRFVPRKDMSPKVAFVAGWGADSKAVYKLISK